MLSNTKILSAVTVFAAASFGTVSTAQAAVSWTNPSGVADSYSFTDGGSSTGRYDDPIISSNSLLFTPTDYIASSSGDMNVSETLSVTLNANSGLQFNTLTFGMGGDYAALGQAFASAGAVMTVENLDTNQTLTSVPDFEGFAGGDGLFQIDGSLNLPGGWSNVLVKITGDLFAGGSDQSSSAIQIKSLGLDASTAAVVPIPAAAFAAPLLLLGGLKARKRFSKKH